MPPRRDGFLPIREYAALGDGRTVALVGSDGAVDWLPLPTVDAPPAFAGVLDPDDGGAVRLAARDVERMSRRYVDGTNVLETTFVTPTGTARVTDSLNVGDAGRLPWNELARRVEGISGEVDMTWSVAVGNRFATARPWTWDDHELPRVTIADQNLAVITDQAGVPRLDGHVIAGGFRTSPGSRHLLGLVATDGEPILVPTPESIDNRIDRTVEAWRRWDRRVGYRGRWGDAVRRSALALKLLIHAPTGAVAAAPTTSLPEAVGGERNYDYRFAWVRDMSFVIEALARLGLHEEVHGCLSWLLSTVARTAPDIHVFYSLDGRPTEAEAEVPLQGYRDSRPVMSGNGAAGQRQLGTFGDLLEAIWCYVGQGNVIDAGTADLIAACADRVCDLWRRTDAGIWELGEQHHYTSSKIGCWAALDRACRLVEQGRIAARRVKRWEVERDAIRQWVERNCWSQTKEAYTFHEGTERLDAAVLLAARTGFDRGDRLQSTVAAIRSELSRGPMLYRYSGMADSEGAFLACSFWLVEALARLGRQDEAAELMDELVSLTNDVGLLSEEIDPQSRELLGNFPLGLSHLALINAAAAIESTER